VRLLQTGIDANKVEFSSSALGTSPLWKRGVSGDFYIDALKRFDHLDRLERFELTAFR
jgi:hypothetical protein